MSFKSVFQDVRGSVDYVHMEVGRVKGGVDIIDICFEGSLKQRTCDDLAKYVKRDERLPQVWFPSLFESHHCSKTISRCCTTCRSLAQRLSC